MPKRIIIIGLLFCLAGGSTIWNVASDLLRHRFDLNPAILMLPVGIGLLRGRQRSQWWARFWIVLGYIYCAFVLWMVIKPSAEAKVMWFGKEIPALEAMPYIALLLCGFAGGLIVMHRLLYSAKACNYFKSKAEPSSKVLATL